MVEEDRFSVNREKILSFLKFALVFLVCTFGVFLRLRAYLLHNSLFLDEAALALNILGKSFWSLLFPLDYGQVPPPFFAMLSKVVITVFPCNEYSLRLIPLVSSILSIFAFWYLAKKLLDNYFTLLVAVAVFSLNFPLTFYAQDFKQYSSDVLCFLLCFIVLLNISFKCLDYKKLSLLGVFYALMMWCSHPMIFFIGSGFLVFVGKYFKERDFSAMKKTAFTFAIPLLSLAILYFVNLKSWHGESGLVHYWLLGFGGFSPELFINNMLSFFIYLNEGLPKWLLELYLMVLFVTGVLLFFKSDKKIALLLGLPILLNMLASQLQMYPFQGRLILYLTPIMILFVVKPLDLLKKNTKLIGVLVLLIFAAAFRDLFVVYPAIFSDVDKVRFYRHETRALYEVMNKTVKPDEYVYVYHLIEKSFRFYDKEYNLSRGIVVKGSDKFPANIKELKQFPSGSKVWFLFVNDNFSAQEIVYFKNWIESNCRDKSYYFSRGSFMIYAQIK